MFIVQRYGRGSPLDWRDHKSFETEEVARQNFAEFIERDKSRGHRLIERGPNGEREILINWEYRKT